MPTTIDIGTNGPSVPIDPTGWYVPPSLPSDVLPAVKIRGQSMLNAYKDAACTNRISEHWDAATDSNPVTTLRALPIPFAGTVESGVMPIYLKCATGLRTEGLVAISVDDIYRTGSSEDTKNRWMISRNPYLDGEFWGNTIYLDEYITDSPMPIYIRARTMGPPSIGFTINRDAVALDYSVHIIIDASIVEA